jgi:hypothetical protein
VPPYLSKINYYTDEGNKRFNRKYINNQRDNSIDTNIHVAEGSDIDLICEAIGKPHPLIKWYKNENRISYRHHYHWHGGGNFKANNENKSKKIKQNSELLLINDRLRLKNLTRFNQYSYECIADNGVPPSISRTFTINVIFEPKLIKFEIFNYCHQNRLFKQIETEQKIIKRRVTYPTLIMNCIGEARPEPMFKWYYNGSLINKINPYLSQQFDYDIDASTIEHAPDTFLSQLKIYKYSMGDLTNTSYFECRIQNKLGSVDAKLKICSQFTDYFTRLNSQQNQIKNDDKEEEDYIFSNEIIIANESKLELNRIKDTFNDDDDDDDDNYLNNSNTRTSNNFDKKRMLDIDENSHKTAAIGLKSRKIVPINNLFFSSSNCGISLLKRFNCFVIFIEFFINYLLN